MPDRHIDDWLSYLAGALLTLLYKWGKYIGEAKKRGLTTKQATQEWFFEASADNVCSWTVTVGIIWIGGSVYISRANLGWDWIQNVPIMCSFAFLLGALLELYAPAVARWILNKLPLVSAAPPEQR